MSLTNKAAVQLLNEKTILAYPERVVEVLVEGGFVEADISEPERIIGLAKKWVRSEDPKNVYNYASGWSTSSWEAVLSERLNDNDSKIRNVNKALFILAKEAGEV